MIKQSKNIFLILTSCVCITLAQYPCEKPFFACILSSDIINHDIDKYFGETYLFYNILQYDGNEYHPPYPYKDGRVRNGKYKASQTALNNYIQGLSKYNGKRFSLVNLTNVNEKMPGVIMACENGDTLLFNANIVDAQFVKDSFITELKKDIGIKDYYMLNRSNRNLITDKIKEDYAKAINNGYNYFYGFRDVETGNIIYHLPYLSEWRITNVSYDTTFVGDKNIINNEINKYRFSRIKTTIENSFYGKYDYFFANIFDLNIPEEKKEQNDMIKKCNWRTTICMIEDGVDYDELPYIFSTSLNEARSYSNRFKGFHFAQIKELPSEDLEQVKKWAQNGYIEAIYAKALLIDKETCDTISCGKQIIEAAKKGYPVAIDYIIGTIKHSQNSNITDNDKITMIKKALEKYGLSNKTSILFNQILKNMRTSHGKALLLEYANKYNIEIVN